MLSSKAMFSYQQLTIRGFLALVFCFQERIEEKQIERRQPLPPSLRCTNSQEVGLVLPGREGAGTDFSMTKSSFQNVWHIY